MSAAASSRQQVLDRIRAATRNAASSVEEASASWSALPRGYVRRGALSQEARIALMLHRLREYDAEVTECAPDAVPAAIAAQIAASGRRRFVAPAGLSPEWLAAGFDWKIDHNLGIAEIERAEGVVTSCFCGVADSGTIVLHHSGAEGRRVLSLLPDWHLCILRASQVVETLPEYFSRCGQTPGYPSDEEQSPGTPGLHPSDEEQSPGTPGLHPSDEEQSPGTPGLVTWISGPSATADIEMTRIKGVHGPRFLHVILVRDQGGGEILSGEPVNREVRPGRQGETE
jgi:L-lactate dehydrogenase complex protein LldG